MTTATLDRPQHEIALERANLIRSARAKFKRELSELGRGEGCALLAAYLEDDDYPIPPELLRMSVRECLRAVQRVHNTTADLLLRAASIHRNMDRTQNNETARALSLGGLSDGERKRLADVLRIQGEK